MSLLRRVVVLLAAPLFLSAHSFACGQAPVRPARIALDSAPPPIAREFRAAWVATVENMDWPSKPGLTTWAQQREMIAILDKLSELHMNAVVFQVRPAADAFYASSLEPWSEFLTGEMGRAPDPYYDPLAFAIAEAHKRGIELHVWINPYRSRYSYAKTAASNHVSRTHPELVHRYGPYQWMDPGEPEVRALTEKVVVDLVRRYDIDGVHMDDYFYPYPETERHRGRVREIPFPDDATYRRYRRDGGTLSLGDWRRHNVDLLVKELGEKVHAEKPFVKFGVSPFGIWRPGYPSSVRGLDQYNVLYADARKWFNEGWVDYMTPQLYWSVDKPQQRYDQLLAWWAEQNTHGRHLWPGNYTSKVGFHNSAAWRTDEVLEQIRLTRAQPGATGNVHFSMEVFMHDPDNLDERLLADPYREPALVPASPWLVAPLVPTPDLTMRTDVATGDRVVDLRPGLLPARAGSTTPVVAPRPWLWVLQTKSASGWRTQVLPGTAATQLLAARDSLLPADTWLTAVDRVGNASAPVRLALPAF